MTRSPLAALAILATLTLAACGGSSGSKAATTVAAPATTAATAGAAPAAGTTFKDGDVTFAQGMIPHHEQAIEMADMALDPNAGATAVVKEVATKVKAGQDPEIKQLTALLKSWGKPVAMDMSGGHNMETMDGMMSSNDMMSLGKLKGAAFDKSWATMMIAHHNGAIKMAKEVMKDGANPEILALAAKVIAAQQAEITILQPLAG